MRLGWICWVAFAGCTAGSAPTGDDDDCASIADCADGEECLGPNAPQVCGIGPQEGCASSADCGTGTACHAVPDDCSPDGIGSQCGAPCDAAYQGCAEDFTCTDGACVADSCADGFPCPSHQACDPSTSGVETPVYDHTHGCVDMTCADDGGCPLGACVNGICQDGPGSCVVPVAVP
jgi:hypothetical protein